MRTHARHASWLLGLLAITCLASAFVALLAESRTEFQYPTWTVRLWISGCITAVAALILALTVDRRGPGLPGGLLALLLALPIGALLDVRLALMD